jgi:hypothetical protein
MLNIIRGKLGLAIHRFFARRVSYHVERKREKAHLYRSTPLSSPRASSSRPDKKMLRARPLCRASLSQTTSFVLAHLRPLVSGATPQLGALLHAPDRRRSQPVPCAGRSATSSPRWAVVMTIARSASSRSGSMPPIPPRRPSAPTPSESPMARWPLLLQPVVGSATTSHRLSYRCHRPPALLQPASGVATSRLPKLLTAADQRRRYYDGRCRCCKRRRLLSTGWCCCCEERRWLPELLCVIGGKWVRRCCRQVGDAANRPQRQAFLQAGVTGRSHVVGWNVHFRPN